MRNFIDLEKHANLIISVLLATTLIGYFSTPMLLHLELENIFKSFLINDMTHNVISTNLEATAVPPLFFWIKHIFISVFGFSLSSLKLIPALAMSALILFSYLFILKNTNYKSHAVILAIVLATSPFFITASKLVSLDLIYITLYITTSFIFTANIYNNQHSNLANFIAGILIACALSLTGLAGTAPILLNFLLINFIRGGFFINLKFNNPLFIGAGFSLFIAIWMTSLGQIMGNSAALDLIFNYQFLEKFARFNFDENIAMKYITLFIIGGFPWIAILPSGIWNTIKNFPQRFNTNDLRISLPLVSLLNSIMLIVYFFVVEQEFYILLTIFFNFAIIIADRINNAEVKPISILNIVFVIYTVVIMMLFLNEFLNINLINYQFDTTIKQMLINEQTSIDAISNSVFYTMAISYCLSAISLFVYGISQKREFLLGALSFALINLILFSFSIFPNLKNTELNTSRSIDSWLNYSISSYTDNILFYKLKDPTIASKSKRSFYFDDIIKMKKFIDNNDLKTAYLFFNRNEHKLLGRMDKSNDVRCRQDICFIKI